MGKQRQWDRGLREEASRELGSWLQWPMACTLESHGQQQPKTVEQGRLDSGLNHGEAPDASATRRGAQESRTCLLSSQVRTEWGHLRGVEGEGRGQEADISL